MIVIYTVQYRILLLLFVEQILCYDDVDIDNYNVINCTGNYLNLAVYAYELHL